MKAVKGSDTSLELTIDAAFKGMGWAYERNVANVIGKPDFLFRDAKLIVFVHGDFWHGWRFPAWSAKLTLYWKEKIQRNRRRDRLYRQRLRRLGWKVLSFWEHRVRSDLAAVVAEVASWLDGRSVNHGNQIQSRVRRRR